MPKVNIIGIGPGNEKTFTKEAEDAIQKSICLLGDKRVMIPFEKMGKPIIHSTRVSEIMNHLKAYGENDEVAIIVSGDVGFYSLAKTLLGSSHGDNALNLICGISSLQYFCSKLKISWDDVMTISLHGRDANIVDKVINNKKVFILTGGNNTPSTICKLLCDYNLSALEVSVGENLSYDNEKITTASAKVIAENTFSPLSVMMIINADPQNNCTTHGLPDDLFIRGEVPMTKQEIRAVTISKLAICSADIVYDVGAGTGSVAVEIARQVKDGYVYAIEKNPEALKLIEANKKKFFLGNIHIVDAFAPEGLENLPTPDKVFIGGSGGNLESILDIVFRKNPDVRVVINAITIETLNEVLSYAKQRPELEVEIVNITVSKAKKMGQFHLMAGQNPVYVMTMKKGTLKIT